MSRRLLIVLSVLATAFVAAQAQDRVPKVNPKNKGDIKRAEDNTDPKMKIEDAATQQERLKGQFETFRQKLVGLAQRLENSTKPEDKDKAKVLRAAIAKASEEGIETRFSSLVDMLRGSDAFKNTDQLTDIMAENEKLRKSLREILDLLTRDDRDAEIRREKELARKLLEELKIVIRRQELVLNKTQIGRTKNQDLAKNQKNVRDATDRLINPNSNQGKDPKHGEGKDNKSGKQGIGEAKEDTKGPKADAKDKDSKQGEGKDGKSGEGKDGKQGEGKDGKSGEGKDGKSGEGKDGKSGEGKDGKQGEGKDGKSGEGKDGKQGENKDGKTSKQGESKDGKQGAAKSGESKTSKPGDGKSGQSKPGAGKSGDGKGKGEGKGDPKGGSGKSGQSKAGEGKSGQSGQQGQPGQQGQSEGKSGGQKQQQQQQQQQSQSQEQTQAKKKIQEAEKYQDDAIDKLRKDNRKDAPEDEQQALDKLNQAKKQLEDLLRQLREEEIERLLARLEARCRHMLAMQIAVRDGTVELDKVIQANPDKQPTRADHQSSLVLSDKEDEIVKEARAGEKLLEAEGSAVAFYEVFQQVRGDMETVSTRLRKTDTGVVTVTIENQIIETLQEMIEALKKAQADAKAKKGQSGPSGPPPDPKLIDLLAELKMIRSMQKRVNDRTELYGKQYAGEQAPTPESGGTPDERERFDRIQNELKDLSKRQMKIGKVTHDIATGKNESK